MSHTVCAQLGCGAAARRELRALLPARLHTRRRSPCAVHASSNGRRLQRLPRITFSYDRSLVKADELADLLAHVACFAPGQSFHWEGGGAAGGGASGSRSTSTSSGGGSGGGSAQGLPDGRQRPARLQPALLRGALARSLVCVAAYAEERALPPQVAASLTQQQAQQQQEESSSSGSGGMPWRVSTRRARPRRVLVGFARAVGDAALVATLHDVAVLPALQGLGLGRQLVERLCRQLDTLGIVDVGLLAPDSSHAFFKACSFGKDTEESVVMTLSCSGIEQRAGLPLEGAAAWIKPQAQAAAGPPAP